MRDFNMRINGFTQIKAFYSWTFSNQEKQIKPQHISLYLFLLNQNNRNNWIEWFKCPFDLAMTGSCISSKKTYYNCLNDLQEWGLIKYQKGSNNWKAPLIKIEVLKDTSTVPQSEPQSEQVYEPLLTTLPTHIYKLITDNKKLIINKLDFWINSEEKENNIKQEILKSQIWIESICKNKRITYDVCLNYLNTFLNDAELKDELNDLKDSKKHFVNWLNIKLKNEPQQQMQETKEPELKNFWDYQTYEKECIRLGFTPKAQ